MKGELPELRKTPATLPFLRDDFDGVELIVEVLHSMRLESAKDGAKATTADDIQKTESAVVDELADHRGLRGRKNRGDHSAVEERT